MLRAATRYVATGQEDLASVGQPGRRLRQRRRRHTIARDADGSHCAFVVAASNERAAMFLAGEPASRIAGKKSIALFAIDDLRCYRVSISRLVIRRLNGGQRANRTRRIEKLALHEAPFIVDDSRPTTEDAWVRIREAGERGDAVKVFLKAVGVPAFFIAMPLLPVWSKLLAEFFGA
jgi:hypothetical protein